MNPAEPLEQFRCFNLLVTVEGHCKSPLQRAVAPRYIPLGPKEIAPTDLMQIKR